MAVPAKMVLTRTPNSVCDFEAISYWESFREFKRCWGVVRLIRINVV